MAPLMTIVMILYLATGFLMAALAVPLVRRKVGPNPLYGFRVRKTLDNPDVWYDANAYAGRCLVGLGAGTSVASVVLYFVPGMNPLLYVLACLSVLLLGLSLSVLLSFRYLHRLGP